MTKYKLKSEKEIINLYFNLKPNVDMPGTAAMGYRLAIMDILGANSHKQMLYLRRKYKE